jgi:hypothetical protein
VEGDACGVTSSSTSSAARPRSAASARAGTLRDRIGGLPVAPERKRQLERWIDAQGSATR